jgi:hypothetical protein
MRGRSISNDSDRKNAESKFSGVLISQGHEKIPEVEIDFRDIIFH